MARPRPARRPFAAPATFDARIVAAA